MRFAYPYFLLLLVPLALAAAWRVLASRRFTRASLYPAVPGFWRRSLTPSERLAAAGPLGLKLLALALIALALARPQKLSSRIAGLAEGIDIMLAVDTSLSMGALDFDPANRLDAAKDNALRFIRQRVHDRIGLVVFGGATQLGCPLTLDYDALSRQVDGLSPGMTRADGTAIGDGLVSALNRLKDSAAKSKVVILLTDGRSNTGLIDPITAAKTAKSLGVKVYAVGTASRGQAVLPIDDPARGRVLVRIDDDLDEDLLSEIARITDGRFFRATNRKELRRIYDEIDALEKSEVKLPDLLSRRDVYHWPALSAALLLLLQAALSNTRLLRWP
ncbi:MAG: VWA domain-containing protein [Elusimicrobia bacterium]|nr:VWA domain-containing protein [Elusimicrobiota bacterium]